MKLLFTISMLCMSLSLGAKTWKVGSKVFEVSRCPDQYCRISTPCLDSKKTECLALKAMKKKVKAESGPGGTNPGSAVCQKHHKGSVFIAQDEKANQVAFCRFSDESFLSLDGLWHW